MRSIYYRENIRYYDAIRVAYPYSASLYVRTMSSVASLIHSNTDYRFNASANVPT